MFYRVSVINNNTGEVRRYWDCATIDQAEALKEVREEVLKLREAKDKFHVEISEVRK